MKNFVVIFLFLFIFSGLFAQEKMQDVVYLKDGSIVRGVVIEQIVGESVKIQTMDGSIFVYKMNNVSKITKEPIISVKEIDVSAKPKTPVVLSTKSPGTAAVLSVLVPGLGNIYAEKVGTGLWHMLVISLNYAAYMSDPEKNKWSGPVALLLHIFDIYEAYDNATAYNERLIKEHSLNVAPIKDGLILSLSMKF